MLPSAQYVMMAWPATQSGASFEAGGNNVVSLIKIYMPGAITISYVVVGTYSQFQNDVFGCGLYTLTGNLIFQTGAVLVPTDNIHQIYTPSITPVTVGSGMYWLGLAKGKVASVPDGPTFEPMATPSLVTNLINEGGRLIIGTANNAAVDGVLPSTLGGVTNLPIPGSSLFSIIKFGS